MNAVSNGLGNVAGRIPAMAGADVAASQKKQVVYDYLKQSNQGGVQQ